MHEGAAAPAWTVDQWFNSERPLALDELRGRIVLLHAFQMLCPGCVSYGVPQAERVHRQYAEDGVAVVGLHTVFEHHAAMTPVALEVFLHEYHVTHPIGVDAAVKDGSIPATMRRYAMRGTPTLILIDRAGRVRFHEFGRIDDLKVGFLLGRLLSEDAPTTAHAGLVAGIQGCDEEGCTP